jgi:hypothetical protein
MLCTLTLIPVSLVKSLIIGLIAESPSPPYQNEIVFEESAFLSEDEFPHPANINAAAANVVIPAANFLSSWLCLP